MDFYKELVFYPNHKIASSKISGIWNETHFMSCYVTCEHNNQLVLSRLHIQSFLQPRYLCRSRLEYFTLSNGNCDGNKINIFFTDINHQWNCTILTYHSDDVTVDTNWDIKCRRNVSVIVTWSDQIQWYSKTTHVPRLLAVKKCLFCWMVSALQTCNTLAIITINYWPTQIFILMT